MTEPIPPTLSVVGSLGKTLVEEIALAISMASHQRRYQSQQVLRTIRIGIMAASVTMALLAGGWRFAQMFGSGPLYAADEIQIKQVVVSTGDTLWQLAIEHGPEGIDPRRVVAHIRELNELHTASIKPGMVLHIPVRM